MGVKQGSKAPRRRPWSEGSERRTERRRTIIAKAAIMAGRKSWAAVEAGGWRSVMSDGARSLNLMFPEKILP